MKFFNYYLGIILLCTIAGIAARYLVPSSRDVALMYMNSGQYAEAAKRYERMMAEGDDSANVIIPLARLYERLGETRKAVGLLVRYIHRNPDMPDIRKVLRSIYDRSVSREDYLRILEQVPGFAYPDEVLWWLSGWYESTLQDHRQVDVLTAMVNLPYRRERRFDFDRLVFYYSVNMKMNATPALVRQLLLRIGERDKEGQLISALTMLLYRERYREAMVLANRYLIARKKPQPFEVEKIVDVFLNAGQVRVARELCNRFLSGRDAERLLELCRLRMEALGGGETAALELLRRDLDTPGKCSERLCRYGFDLALKSGDRQLAMNMVTQSALGTFSDLQIFDYAFLALKEGKPEMAAVLKRKLEAERFRHAAVLDFILDAAMKKLNVAAMTALAMKDPGLVAIDRVELGFLLFRYDCRSESWALVRDTPIGLLLTFFLPRELAALAVEEGEAEALGVRCEREMLQEEEIRRRIFQDFRFVLAAASGEDDTVRRLVGEYGNITPAVLMDAYSVAWSFRCYDCAVTAARALRQRTANEMSAYFLADACFRAGNPGEALQLVMPLKARNRFAEGLFLRIAAAMIASGSDLWSRPGMREEVEQTMTRVRARENATPNELKSVAVCLAALDRKTAAEAIYSDLCRRGEIRPDDIDELVKLCARAPGPELREWFLAQARKCRVSERWRWLGRLNRLGMAVEAAAMVERTYKRVEADYLAEYLTALAELKKEDEIDRVLARFGEDRLRRASLRERLALIDFLVRNDRSKAAAALLHSVSDREMLAHLTPSDIASMLIGAGQEARGLQFAARSRNRRGAQVTLYLKTYAGDEEFVRRWLESDRRPREQVLADIYYFAQRSQRTALALAVAQRMFRMADNADNRMRLAEALIADRRFEDGLKLIGGMALTHRRAAEIYLAGASGLASDGKFSRDGEEAKRLNAVCDMLLKGPPAPPRPTVIAVAYALMSTGYYARAKTLFYQLAESSRDLDDSFLKLYLFNSVMAPSRQDFKQISGLVERTPRADEDKVIAMLDTYGMSGQIMMLIRKRYANDVPRKLYAKYLSCLLKCRQMRTLERMVRKLPPPDVFNPRERYEIFVTLILAKQDEKALVYFEALKGHRKDIPPHLIRQLGAYLSSRQDYQRAIAVFLDLARENGDPDSADVGVLTSLPGVGDHPQVVQWLASRARSSTGEAQLKWLEYLNFIRKPQEVIAILKPYYMY